MEIAGGSTSPVRDNVVAYARRVAMTMLQGAHFYVYSRRRKTRNSS